ncbi:MAG: hypothetical protein U9N55_02680 [candidate division Zixibacteria bacterium]|nr:hypothetical protein [candidate division Zixibacteria bacterium]
MDNRNGASSSMNKDDQQELADYRILKPYIFQCLTLNRDIINPMVKIIGYTELLLQETESFTDEQRNSINQIADCAEHIRELVNSLGANKISLEQKIDLKEIIEACRNAASSQTN